MTYASTRRPDPRIARRIDAALGDARSVADVGAGTGSYEPRGRAVVAIEPSAAMIAQRPESAAPAVLGEAEALPLADDSVDATLAVLSVHHFGDVRRGVREMVRVARRRVVVVSFDPDVLRVSWVRHYAPSISALDAGFPSIAALLEWTGASRAEPIAIPHDCSDLFLEAWFGRPELMLDPLVRANTSGFALLGERETAAAVERLRRDLDSGEWDRRWGALRAAETHDGGLRLVVAELA